MNGSGHGLYLLAAYGGALLLIVAEVWALVRRCLLYTSPSPRDGLLSRMPSSA